MNAVFFHDVRIFYQENEAFSVDFGYEVWLRYLKVFEQLVVVTRAKDASSLDVTRLKRSSGDNVSFVKVPDFKSIKSFYRYFQAKKIIEEEVKKADAIIARNSTIANIAANYAIKYNKPFAYEVVGCPWGSLWNYGNIQGKIMAPFAYFRTKKIAKKSPFTLYVTNEFLQKRYPSRGYSISCSDVDLPKLEDKILEKRIEKIKRFDPNETIKIGMIGALTSKYKGFDLAIKALKDLNNKYKNVELHLLGSGDKSKWKNFSKKMKVQDKVIFEGTLPSGEPVFKWLDNMDIYIQPSKQEGLPRALIEAMSRGCPAVGSKTGGIPELLDQDFVHKKGNYKDLTVKIDKFISNKEIMIHQAKRNFAVSKQYSKEILDKKRTKFWNEFRKYVENRVVDS